MVPPRAFPSSERVIKHHDSDEFLHVNDLEVVQTLNKDAGIDFNSRIIRNGKLLKNRGTARHIFSNYFPIFIYLLDTEQFGDYLLLLRSFSPFTLFFFRFNAFGLSRIHSSVLISFHYTNLNLLSIASVAQLYEEALKYEEGSAISSSG
jgi:hypothetical protein